MEAYTSPNPIPIAEVAEIDLGKLAARVREIYPGDFFPAHFSAETFPDLNSELGLDDLPIKPKIFRLLKQSNQISKHWHYDGGMDLACREYLPDIAIFSSSHPTEVIVGKLPIKERGWNAYGPENHTVEEALRSGSAQQTKLIPNIFYILPGGAIHRKPSSVDAETLRLFGRWTI